MKKIFLLLGIILFCAIPAFSERINFEGVPFHLDRDNPGVRDLDIPFESGSLPNGVQFLLHVDRSLPLVHLNQWFTVGRRDERGKTGMTHLIEHLLFREPASGAESASKGLSTDDQVILTATVPTERLDSLLRFEASRLTDFCDIVNPRKVALEKEILKSEFNKKRSGRNTLPQWDMVWKYLYPPFHPYFQEGNDPAGIDQILTEDVKAFYAGNFTADKLNVVLAGDFDPDEARKLIAQYYGGLLPSVQKQVEIKRFPVEIPASRVLEIPGVPGFRETSCRFFPLPGRFEPSFNGVELGTIILDGGQMGRFREVERRENRRVRLFCDLNGKELCSELLIGAEILSEVSLDSGERILGDEIARLALEGPSQDELQRAKALWLAEYQKSFQTLGSRAYLLNSFLIGTGNPADWKGEIDRTLSLTVSEVREEIKKNLADRNCLIVRTKKPRELFSLPGVLKNFAIRAKTAHLPIRGEWHQVSPPSDSRKPKSQPAFSPPEIFERKLGNGFTVLVHSRNGLPKISIDFVLKAGSMFDPPGKEGTAYLAALAAFRGAGNSTRERIGLELDRIGASLEEWVRLEGTGMSVECMKDNIVQVVEILSKVVRQPWFHPGEVDSLRREIQTGPVNEDARLMQNAVFAQNEFLCRPVSGSEKSVSGISPEDLKNFHGYYWKPEKSALVFSGDVDPEKAVLLARKFFGDWEPGSSAPEPASLSFNWPAPDSKRVFLVDRFQANRVRIFQIIPAPGSGNGDSMVFSCWLAIHRRRLIKNLRETRGWCYDVTGRVLTNKAGSFGYIMINAPRERASEILKELDLQLKAFGSQSRISQEELAETRLSMSEGFPQEFESCTGLGSRIAFLWLFGRKMPIPGQIAGVNLPMIEEMQNRFASPEKSIYLLEGEKETVRKAVIEAGLGDFQWLNPGLSSREGGVPVNRPDGDALTGLVR